MTVLEALAAASQVCHSPVMRCLTVSLLGAVALGLGCSSESPRSAPPSTEPPVCETPCDDTCCEEGAACVEGSCQAACVPACDGRDCGDDGCGGTCGICGVGTACSPQGACTAGCAASCGARACGDDGCGGTCGTCTAPSVCTSKGTCEAPLGKGAFILHSDIVSYSYGFLESELRAAGASVSDGGGLPRDLLTTFRLVVVAPQGRIDKTLSAALATFVQAGGGVVLIAERAGVGGAATVNAIAAELGVSARVREDDFAQGCNVAKAVGTHPLVSGASDLAYAWGSTTTGGTSLFRLGDKDVVTVEGSVVLAGDSDSFGDGGSLGSCGPEVGKTFFANLYRALPSR